MDLIYLIIVLAIGLALGFVIGRYALKTKQLESDALGGENDNSQELLNDLDKKNALLEASLREKQLLLDETRAKLESITALKHESELSYASLLTDSTNQKEAFKNLNEDLQKSVDKFNAEQERRLNSEKRVIELENDKKSLQEKLETERKQLAEIQEKFTIEFENLANKILKQNTQDFNTASSKNMADILDPLKEKLQIFEKKVQDTYDKGLKDQNELQVELRKLHDLSLKLDQDARSLTNALKSDTKKQGNWGEIILERVLERSGLVKDQEYFVQQTARNEEGELFRPDVVVKLPDNKHIIIDSKVSLTAYTQYVSEEDDTKKDAALKLHLTSVKKHVKELSAKSYDSLKDFNSPDFVLMFMPIEPAFALAVQSDAELFNFAWKERVIIVSPTTLLATLRTVASIWKYEKQNQNAMEIALRGGKLYDKFESFVKDLESVGANIQRASKSYDDAHKKLSSGSGNLIRQVEHLKKMGVPTKKNLADKYLIDDE